MELQYISTDLKPCVELQFIPNAKKKLSNVQYDFSKIAVRAFSAKGLRMDKHPVKKMIMLKS